MIIKILSIPRSLYYNIKLFGIIKGCKIPILLSNHTKVYGINRRNIEVNNPKRFGVQIGFGGTVGIEENRHSYLVVGDTGKIVFDETAIFGAGSSIRVDSGICIIGKDFSCNKNCCIACDEQVVLGAGCLLGWNVSIRDADGHSIIYEGEIKKTSSRVEIGKNVWIAANVNILKGVLIPDNCVIGCRSCLTKKFTETNCLIAGYPAKILQRNITWKK